MEYTPSMLVLRCYAKKEQGKWQAFCLDLCLAAQADDFESAKKKLQGMIASYVDDAVAGEDQEHAAYLLNRKAPIRYIAKYNIYVLLQNLGALHANVRKAFQEVLPLSPIAHRAVA